MACVESRGILESEGLTSKNSEKVLCMTRNWPRRRTDFQSLCEDL